MNLTIEHETTEKIFLDKKSNTDLSKNIMSQLKSHLEQCEDSVFVINPSEIKYRYQLIQSLLPVCKHYFAVKSCPQKIVIDEIKNLSGYFDVASNGELDLLKKSNVNIQNCIHTHPIKKVKEIEVAIESGIDTFVIDNEFELEKFEDKKQQVQFMLRLSFSNSDATIDLSSKFGMPPNEALPFIIKARMKGFKIKGLCFHVGSQMPNNKQYLNALAVCCEIFNEASEIGIKMNTIDIGGGFPFDPVQNMTDLKAFLDPINQYLETYFADVACWAEPGRFISTPIATLVCQVVGKSIKVGKPNYYLNDGVYGCLSNKIFDFYDMSKLKASRKDATMESSLIESNIYGPTCDSIDIISDVALLPEMRIGDYLLFENMGAYTIATTTNFNMLGNAKVVILDF